MVKDCVMKIREIDPTNKEEIKLVAQRMQSTLIDVLGKRARVSLYTLDWLEDRVKWHLNPSQTRAKIFLSENFAKEITGQAIGRIEMGDDGIEFGYFSTIYIASEFQAGAGLQKNYSYKCISGSGRWA